MSDQSHPEMSDAAFMPPPPPAPSMSLKATNTGNGRLTASGVLQIIEGALFAIFSLWFFSITQSQIGEFADDLTGGDNHIPCRHPFDPLNRLDMDRSYVHQSPQGWMG